MCYRREAFGLKSKEEEEGCSASGADHATEVGGSAGVYVCLYVVREIDSDRKRNRCTNILCTCRLFLTGAVHTFLHDVLFHAIPLHPGGCLSTPRACPIAGDSGDSKCGRPEKLMMTLLHFG